MGVGELLRETPLPLLFLGKHVVKTKRGEGVCVSGGLSQLQLWGRFSTWGDGTFWNADNPLTWLPWSWT